jgi:hypothetical protein
VPIGFSKIVKMQEPNDKTPLLDTPPEASVNGTVVAPAAGVSNVRVVAAVVPNAGTAEGNETVFAALRVAIAAGIVLSLTAITTGASTTATKASSPPPQAAKAATAINENANLAGLLKKLRMDKIPYKKVGQENADTLPQVSGSLAEFLAWLMGAAAVALCIPNKIPSIKGPIACGRI